MLFTPLLTFTCFLWYFDLLYFLNSLDSPFFFLLKLMGLKKTVFSQGILPGVLVFWLSRSDLIFF